MKKIIGIVIGIVIIGVGATALYLNVGPMGETVPEQKTIRHFAPQSTPLIVEATNLRNLDEAFKNLNLSRQFQQSKFRDLYRNRVAPMLKSFQTRETKSQLATLNKITDLLGNELLVYGEEETMRTVAVYNLRRPENNVEKPYQPIDQLLNERLVNRVKNLESVTHNTKSYRQLTIHELSFQLPEETKSEKINKLDEFVRQLSVQYARLHNHLLIGIGNEAIKDAVDRYASSEQPRSTIVKKQSKKPRLTYQVKGSYLVSMYDYLEKAMPDEVTKQNQFNLNKKIMRGYETTRGSLTFRKGLLTFDNELHWDPEKLIPPLKPGLKQPPKQLETNRYLPKNTVFSLATLSPQTERVFNWYLNEVIKPRFFAGESGPDNSVIEATLPIDGIKRMLNALDTEIGFGVYLNNRFFDSLYRRETPPTDQYPLSGLISLEVEDQSALNRAFDEIGQNPFVNYRPAERRITFDLVLFELPLHLSKHDGHTLIGLNQDELSRAIKRYNNRSGLASLKRFRSMRSKLPDRVNQLSYFSAVPWARPLRHDWLKTFAPERRRQIVTMAGFDPLKEIGRVMRGTRGTVGGQWNTPEKNLAEGAFYTSGDVLMPTTTIAAGAAVYPYFKNKIKEQMETGETAEQTSLEQEKNQANSKGEQQAGQASLSAAIYD